MPQVLLSESISAELGAQEPWPSDVRFFQPFEVEQILLADSAACLSVAAFLRMCNLKYRKDERANAEYMSPSGRVPFIKAGSFVVAELDHIITFVGHKNVSLIEHLDSSQKADMRAYMSLVSNVLGSAELYVSWVDPDTYASVTYPRYCSVHPWPLSSVLAWRQRRTVLARLHLLGWRHKTIEEVYGEVDNCCRALSQRLENLPFFFGSSPTELDAVVFGHLYTLLTTPLPDARLAAVVRSYPTLVSLCHRLDGRYFCTAASAAEPVTAVTPSPSATPVTSAALSISTAPAPVTSAALSPSTATVPSAPPAPKLATATAPAATTVSDIDRNGGEADRNGSNGDYDKLEDITGSA